MGFTLSPGTSYHVGRGRPRRRRGGGKRCQGLAGVAGDLRASPQTPPRALAGSAPLPWQFGLKAAGTPVPVGTPEAWTGPGRPAAGGRPGSAPPRPRQHQRPRLQPPQAAVPSARGSRADPSDERGSRGDRADQGCGGHRRGSRAGRCMSHRQGKRDAETGFHPEPVNHVPKVFWVPSRLRGARAARSSRSDDWVGQGRARPGPSGVAKTVQVAASSSSLRGKQLLPSSMRCNRCTKCPNPRSAVGRVWTRAAPVVPPLRAVTSRAAHVPASLR